MRRVAPNVIELRASVTSTEAIRSDEEGNWDAISIEEGNWHAISDGNPLLRRPSKLIASRFPTHVFKAICSLFRISYKTFRSSSSRWHGPTPCLNSIASCAFKTKTIGVC
jgi:hypothetical protein